MSETEYPPQYEATGPVCSRSDEDSSRRRGFELLMVFVIAAMLAGTCFLISAGHGTKQGYKPWSPNSILHVITDIINFNFAYPTARGAEVKWLAHGLATAAALVVGGIAWFVCTRRQEDSVPVVAQRPHLSLRQRLSNIFPPSGAMAMLLLFGGWSILSGTWSKWPTASMYAGIHQMMFILWAIVLGLTLGREGVRKAAAVIVVVTVLTAGLGIWYHVERSPEMRLEFPIGNPLFMATCLISGILPGFAFVGYALRGLIKRKPKEEAEDTSSAQSAADRSTDTSVPWKLVLPLGLGLVVLLWAFKMTDSRGPLLGLIFGSGVSAYLIIKSQNWRTVIIVIAILGLALGCWWLRKQLSIQEQGRGATIRLRLYAWNYAGSMLMDTPLAGQEEKEALGSRMLPLIVGQGEGTYILYAQQLSRRHAEQDPQAFQGQVLAHAHNHWLETMAELGAIGLALVATGLGVTIWAGIVTLRGDMEPIDRWCLVGLLGALTAIMFGETFNVGLNKPGPPMFFYTLVGLTWGMARSYLPRHAPKKQGAHRLVRASGLAVVLVSAAVVVSISWRNWEGALAYKKIEQQVNEGNWEQALAYSEEAARARLTPADRLLALNGRLSAMQSAANVQVQRITQMIQRTQGREVDSNIRTLAREDSNAFQRYAQECIHTGQRMWNLVPAYPRVAFRVSQCWLMRGQMEQALKALGLKEEASQYIQPVREWLYREYFYHRLNRYLAFRMLRFAGGWPLSKRLDILRMPLRVTQADDEFEQVLAGYLDEQNFDQQMNELLSRAQAIQQHPEKRPWPDAYAPETFRLAALARKLRGAFEQAAELAQQGKKLSAFVDHRFPAVTLRAQLEQAHYLFLAQPDKPEKSIQMSQAAVDAWPEQAVGQTDLEPMRQRIWLYMLAGGQEQRVREILKKRVAHLQGQELKADLDQGLAELYTRLAQMFGGFPDRKRPMAFEEWLERATALSPQWPQSHLVAARYYLEKGVDAKAVRHLKILNRIFEQAPARMQRVLQSLRQRFPNNYALQGFIDKWVRSLQTRPAEQEGQNNSN